MIVPDRPLPEEIEAARWRPDGYVVRIVRSLDPAGEVPPDAVIGAWPVDGRGRIAGPFIVNPDYDPVRWPDASVDADAIEETAFPGARALAGLLGRLMRRMARLWR